MKELTKAIKTRFDAIVTTASRLYDTVANQNATFPYVVVSYISDVEDQTFTEYFEDCLVQFAVYDEDPSSENVLDIFEELKTAFDRHTLTVENYSTIIMYREGGANKTRYEEQGKKIWQLTCTYRVLLQAD